MNHQIKLTPTALNDLQNAIYYYNNQQKGLGKSFDTAIKRMLTQIKKYFLQPARLCMMKFALEF